MFLPTILQQRVARIKLLNVKWPLKKKDNDFLLEETSIFVLFLTFLDTFKMHLLDE